MDDKNKYIKEELQEFAPTLSKIEKAHRAMPPAGYFTKMQEDIQHKLESNSKEEQMLEGYFDQLPEQVMTKIKPSATVRILNLQRWAAVFIVVIAASFLLFNQLEKPSQTEDFVTSLNEDEMLYLLGEYSSTDELVLLAEDIKDPIQVPDEIEAEELLYLMDEIDLFEELEL